MTQTNYESSWRTEDARIFQRTVRNFVEAELAPRLADPPRQASPNADSWPVDSWTADTRTGDTWPTATWPTATWPTATWTKAGQAGLLLPDVPDQYGGGGGSFAHEAVVIEELARAGAHIGFGVHSIVAHYILTYGTEAQKQRWLPRMASAEMIGAIAMTEPDAGSDLHGIRTTARKDGEHYVINGSKTFITNAQNANLVCLVVKTAPDGPPARAMSVVMLETEGLSGYRVGRPLQKIGRHDQDTSELFFDGVRTPVDFLLGAGEGRGLFQLMDQLSYERLAIALSAVASAEHAVELTTQHAKQRKLFGKPLLDLQNTRFTLAECKTEAHIARVFIDNCIEQFIAGRLDGVTAAMAKYWLTDCEGRIIDQCVQLHGGYGYMQEFPIARMWVDSRVQRIYAGSNEVMKAIIGSSL
jgi:acyl-CoA dehydrogenase